MPGPNSGALRGRILAAIAAHTVGREDYLSRRGTAGDKREWLGYDIATGVLLALMLEVIDQLPGNP